MKKKLITKRKKTNIFVDFKFNICYNNGKMKIKELLKKYPYKKVQWYAYRISGDSYWDKFPNWDYKDDDEVINYEYISEAKSVDITDAIFKGGKIKTYIQPRVKVYWKRKEEKPL